jgi:predicted nucleic acid-binding protein
MKIFLDANILVSVLNKEYPLYIYSSRILSLADDSRYQVYTSPTCLAIAFYFAEKKSGTAIAKNKIKLLAEKLKVTPADKNTVLQTLKNSAIHDFEDGLEYYSALSQKCRYIITEDIEDYYFSKIEVSDSQNFVERVVLRKLKV